MGPYVVMGQEGTTRCSRELLKIRIALFMFDFCTNRSLLHRIFLQRSWSNLVRSNDLAARFFKDLEWLYFWIFSCLRSLCRLEHTLSQFITYHSYSICLHDIWRLFQNWFSNSRFLLKLLVDPLEMGITEADGLTLSTLGSLWDFKTLYHFQRWRRVSRLR